MKIRIGKIGGCRNDNGFEIIVEVKCDDVRKGNYLPTFLIHLGGQVGGQKELQSRNVQNREEA